MTEPKETTQHLRRPRTPVADWVLYAAMGMVAATACLQILMFRFGRDQGIYAVIADTVLRGGMPYRDAWDFKPPGIFVVYAAARALLGQNEWGIRAVEVAAVLSLIWSFALLSRRFWGSIGPGIVGGALAALTHAQLEFWHTAQPESFAGPLTAWALVLATRPMQVPKPLAFKPSRSDWASWFFAGVLFGAAGLMKPHLAGAAAIGAVFAAWQLRTRATRLVVQLAPIGAMALGAFGVIAACLLWFVARGAWRDLYQTLFVFAPAYGATTWDSTYFVNYCFYAFEIGAVGLSAPLCAGWILALALDPVSATERALVYAIVGVVAVHFLGIAIQSKFFPYHYGATLPLIALLAGLGYWKLYQRAAAYGPIAIVLFFALFWGIFRARTASRDLDDSFWDRCSERMNALLKAPAAEREKTLEKLSSVADVDYGSNVLVASWIDAHTKPSDCVYIWGFEPFIYDRAQRRPASKYIYNVPQRVNWAKDQTRPALMRDLAQCRPAAIVVEHRDVFPVVTGNNIDSADTLNDFWDLRQLLLAAYDKAVTIQDFDIYVQRPVHDESWAPAR